MANDIVAKEYKLNELLNQKYELDYYQREYVWGTNQIQDLIDDLTNRFRDYFNENWDREKNLRSYKSYFMGSIIISESRESNASYIVDGQQRLTSLTLLLIFLHHSLKGIADSDQILQYIRSSKAGRVSFNLNIDERKDCMESLLKDEGESFITADKEESIINLMSRYDYIKNNFPEDLVEAEQALLCFMDWLLYKVMMSKITATSNNEAYTIFETMNDRGTSLNSIEMLKGYLLANIEDHKSRTDTQKIWQQKIQALRDTGTKLESKCVIAWLRGQHANEMRLPKSGARDMDFELIGNQFHRWVRKNSKKLGLEYSQDFKDFITRDFDFYSYWYRQIYTWTTSYSQEFMAIYSNACLGFNLQFPAILAALRLQDKKEEDIRRKIRIVSTYIDTLLARRMWNHKGLTGDTLEYHMFHTVIRQIRNNSVGDIANILHNNLLKEKKVIPNFDELKKFRLLGNNRNRRVQLFLARITDYIETQSGRSTRFKDYLNKGVDKKDYFEIEHIVADNPEIYEDGKDYVYENRDSIGGLLLLPKSTNSSIGNASYKEKKTAYLQENLLAASLHEDAYKNKPKFNRFIEDSELNFKSYKEFDKEALDERYYLYREIAKKIWDPEQLIRIAEEG